MDREEVKKGYSDDSNAHYKENGYEMYKEYDEWLEDKVIYLQSDVVPTMAKHIENRNERIEELEKQMDIIKAYTLSL